MLILFNEQRPTNVEMRSGRQYFVTQRAKDADVAITLSGFEDQNRSPVQIEDVETTWIRSRCFGQGGFATCYEYLCRQTSKRMAFKIVSKSTLPDNLDRLRREIAIHKELNHERVLKLHWGHEFEEVLVLKLDLCSRNSLKHHLEQQRCIPYPETRYYLRQILEGLVYLHEEARVIHRDLKLDNILLTHDQQIKIADFGLAARVSTCQQTFCGSLSYIAPEMLKGSWYSFEVDIYSTGCILYKLLCGKTPLRTNGIFEMRDVTDSPIKLEFPEWVPSEARILTCRMRDAQREARPTAREALSASMFARPDNFSPSIDSSFFLMDWSSTGSPQNLDDGSKRFTRRMEQDACDYICNIDVINGFINYILRDCHSYDATFESLVEEASINPVSAPLFWLTKWADFSNAFGIVYEMTTSCVTFNFLDGTRLTWLPNVEDRLLYFDANNHESIIYLVNPQDDAMAKKVSIMKWSREYLHNELKAAGDASERWSFDTPEMHTPIPYVQQLSHIEHAHIFLLSDCILQINDMSDHIKYIIDPSTGKITMVNNNNEFRTLSFQQLQRKCPSGLHKQITRVAKAFEVSRHNGRFRYIQNSSECDELKWNNFTMQNESMYLKAVLSSE